MTVRWHATTASASGAIALAVEAALRRESGVGVGLALLLGAGLGAQVGLLLGLVQALVSFAALRLARRLGREGLPTLVDLGPDAPRDPIVRLHAIVLGLAGAVAVFATVAWYALAPIADVTDPRLARTLSIALSGGAAVVGVLAGVAVERAARGPLADLDARIRLPVPHGRAMRFAIWVFLPACLLLVPVLARLGDALGRYALAGDLALVLALEGLLAIALRARLPDGGAGARRLHAGALIGWVALVAATFVAFRAPGVSASAARIGPANKAALGLLRGLTDVDRDGASSLYGGGDCAPFDRKIGPFARDRPGNGVDENCDGKDATSATARGAQRRIFLGKLDPEQITVARYNVVWVIVDAVRADRCGLYGHSPSTTPYLDELAKDSLVFTNAYSQSSATMLSIPSMLSGGIPGALAWTKQKRLELADTNTTLAERLRQLGYRTGIVTDSYTKNKLGGMLQGYAEIEDSWLDGHRMPWYRRNAAIATSLAIRILERDRSLPASPTPFFLTVYSADPHDPYDVHPEGFPHFGDGEMGHYDGEIAFADRYTGFLIDYLRYLRPIWDQTIFVFTADHGEEFGEHGGKTHAYTCHEESTHVPLLVRIPGVAGQRIDARVGLVDIVPTILEAIGGGSGTMKLDGESLLVPALSPSEVDLDRPLFCSVLSQKSPQGAFFRQSVRSGDRVLLHDSITGRVELYDTIADRAEKRDLVAEADLREQPTVELLKGVLEASMTGNLRDLRLTEGEDADSEDPL